MRTMMWLVILVLHSYRMLESKVNAALSLRGPFSQVVICRSCSQHVLQKIKQMTHYFISAAHLRLELFIIDLLRISIWQFLALTSVFLYAFGCVYLRHLVYSIVGCLFWICLKYTVFELFYYSSVYPGKVSWAFVPFCAFSVSIVNAFYLHNDTNLPLRTKAKTFAGLAERHPIFLSTGLQTDIGAHSPPNSISCSRLSILARPQSLMKWSCSIICQVILCRVGRRSNSSPKRPLESYWRSLM